VSTHCGPVCVGIVGLVGECQVWTELGLGRGDGGAHEAFRSVDEEADWIFAVGVVWDGVAVQSASMSLVLAYWVLRWQTYLVVFIKLYVPARALRISCSVQRFSILLLLRGRAVTKDALASMAAVYVEKCMLKYAFALFGYLVVAGY